LIAQKTEEKRQARLAAAQAQQGKSKLSPWNKNSREEAIILKTRSLGVRGDDDKKLHILHTQIIE
jgi:hypothetical protein